MYIVEILRRDPVYKECVWRHHGNPDQYETLTWDNSNTVTKPTLEEITAKWATVKAEIVLEKLREARDRRISATDWWASSDLTMTAGQTAYRQALRDITNTQTPDVNEYLELINVTWPVNPLGETTIPNKF
jgi:hypothetical protein